MKPLCGFLKQAENWKLKQEATGSKKIFFIPQISYTQDAITFFATSEIPLYQNLKGTQIASQYQLTFGINYRFLIKEYESETFRLLE